MGTERSLDGTVAFMCRYLQGDSTRVAAPFFPFRGSLANTREPFGHGNMNRGTKRVV